MPRPATCRIIGSANGPSFVLHPNENDEWVWLTYIQDEMNFLNGHKEYYWVDSIDAPGGKIEVTDANFDKSCVRSQGHHPGNRRRHALLAKGEPASFSDIQVGDKLRTKTHGVGKGKARRCWEVFLDDASLVKFQDEQKQVNRGRMMAEGMPGYVDQAEADRLQLTLFSEGSELFGKLKPGAQVRVAPAGVDRKATGEPTAAVVEETKPEGRNRTVTLKLDQPTGNTFPVGGLAKCGTSKAEQQSVRIQPLGVGGRPHFSSKAPQNRDSPRRFVPKLYVVRRSYFTTLPSSTSASSTSGLPWRSRAGTSITRTLSNS